MIRHVPHFLLVCFLLSACSIFDFLEDVPIQPVYESGDHLATPIVDEYQTWVEGDACYQAMFLSDRGIRAGNQAVVQSPSNMTQQGAELKAGHTSLDVLAIIPPDEIVTILDGPYCYATRNSNSRWWRVRVDSSGATGYMHEYSDTFNVLSIYLNPLVSNAESLEIRHFTISVNDAFGGPARIGDNAYLSWDVAGANSVTVYRDDTGEMVGNGSHNVVPLVVPEGIFGDWTFSLVATNDAGEQLVGQTTLRVDCPDCLDQPPTPAPAINTIQVSYLHFEHGTMFYRTDNGQIYVLFNNGTFSTYADTWQGESYAEIDIPAGFFVPQRGFGKVWQDNANLKSQLGWATGLEVYYSASLSTIGSAIHLQMPDERIAVLEGNRWTYAG